MDLGDVSVYSLCFPFRRFERENIVKLLLERGADPTITADDNEVLSPLKSAARRGNKEICRLLLQDSKVKERMNKGKIVTAFTFACMSGSREVCDLFLAHGADLESSTTTWSSLHVASYVGSEDVCGLLLERGNIIKCVLFNYISKDSSLDAETETTF